MDDYLESYFEVNAMPKENKKAFAKIVERLQKNVDFQVNKSFKIKFRLN